MPVLTIAGLGVLGWTVWYLYDAHAILGSALYLLVSTFVFLGVGCLALRLAKVNDRGLTWAGLRYVVGFALVAFIMTLMGAAGLGDGALWVSAASALLPFSRSWAWA